MFKSYMECPFHTVLGVFVKHEYLAALNYRFMCK
jgi:hypothetical protein